MRFWGRAAGARAEDVDAALDACGLGGRLAGLPVARLSAGQRRRTALACLVARRPELWLLDEPHAGLDHDGRDLLDDLVHRAAGRRRHDRARLPRARPGRGASPIASSRSPAAPSRPRRPSTPTPEERVLVP